MTIDFRPTGLGPAPLACGEGRKPWRLDEAGSQTAHEFHHGLKRDRHRVSGGPNGAGGGPRLYGSRMLYFLMR